MFYAIIYLDLIRGVTMAKKNTKVEKKETFKTKHKVDNSIEVTVTKAPNKTLTGKITVWLISIITLGL